MTNKDFKVWLAKNDINQKELAAKLGINPDTISNYKRNRFPKIFILALEGINSIRRSQVRYISKDQDFQNECSIYWFTQNGHKYGISESASGSQLVDSNNEPVTDLYTNISDFHVTSEMREDY